MSPLLAQSGHPKLHRTWAFGGSSMMIQTPSGGVFIRPTNKLDARPLPRLWTISGNAVWEIQHENFAQQIF